MFDRFIELKIPEPFELHRKRELEIERASLEAKKNDLDERCRLFLANNPAPHNPAAQYLREQGWGDPHPERTRIEQEVNSWLKRWNANRDEYAKLV